MAGPTPIVRQFIPCEQVTYVLGVGYWLLNPRADFVAEPGQEFPLAVPNPSVFIQIGGSYGRHTFRLRLMDVTDPTAEPAQALTTRPQAIDLGPPTGPFRLRVRNWSQRIPFLAFRRPGRYERWMEVAGEVLAKVPILVEEQP
ncbi:MAG: hypothetical protein K2X87_03835 [Gemmataceae bacterium]|nr:hypothetical protein [Gemmataceae bacterium]